MMPRDQFIRRVGWDASPPIRELGRRTFRPIHGVVLALFLAGVLLHVWHRVQVIRVGYQIEQLQVQKQGLERIHQGLEIEVATLTALHRIESAARRLRMRPLHRQQVVVVRVKDARTPLGQDGATVARAQKPPASAKSGQKGEES